MKQVGLWAIWIGMVVSIGPGQAYAVEKEEKCTLATLNGQYLFAGSGTLLPPAVGVTKQSVAASAGYHIFNGDGTGTDFVTFTVNGVNQNVPSPVAITYTLNHDCTGTYSVQNGPHFDMFAAVDGSELSVIVTDPGLSFFRRSQSAGRVQPIGIAHCPRLGRGANAMGIRKAGPPLPDSEHRFGHRQ
jgi:hypothetical protein